MAENVLAAVLTLIRNATNPKLGVALLDAADLKQIAKLTKPKKRVVLSRTARWSASAADAVAALEELQGIQQEFEEWKENLPENLQASALGEKLETITGIDLESALEAAQEAEQAELPLGFGRD